MEGMEPTEGHDLPSDLELSSDDGETSSAMVVAEEAEPDLEPELEPEPEQAVPGMYGPVVCTASASDVCVCVQRRTRPESVHWSR